jgi:hypothetical protein
VSRTLTADEIARFPKWSQGLITGLIEDNKRLTTERDHALNPQGLTKGAVNLIKYDGTAGEKVIPLAGNNGRYARVRFNMGNGEYLEAMLRSNTHVGDVLEISSGGSGGVVVHPSVSNVIYVKVSR